MWNEIFTFDVQSGKEVMELMVYDKDDFGKDDFEGRAEFTLENFID